MKASLIFAFTFLLLILVFSSIALHVQAFIVNGYHISRDQITFPSILMPVSAAFRGHSVSIGLVIAAGLAVGIHRSLLRRFAVDRWHWLSEEDYDRVFRKKTPVRQRAISVITAVASLAGVALATIGVQSYFDGRRASSVDRALVDTSSRMNGKLPMQVDRYTRLDSTVAGPGRRFTYVYTLSGSTNHLNATAFAAALRPSIVNAYKTSPELSTFRDHDVEMHYLYRDQAGKYVTELVVSSKDYK